MDKLFYSLEEAAAKLSKSAEQVRQMASNGQLQEFRDRDKLMFKKEQVDLLAGGGEDVIGIAGELEPLTLASSGTGMDMHKDKDSTGTGINILDIESTDDADANAVTRVSNAQQALVDPGEKSGSGGLLDLTKEADDTSLGAGLLEDVYGSETVAQQTAIDAPAAGGDGGALFESPAGTEPEAVSPVMMAAVAEVYDPKGSWLVGAAALGVALTAFITIFFLVIGFTTTAGSGMLSSMGSFWWAGAAVGGLMLLVAIAGFAIKK